MGSFLPSFPLSIKASIHPGKGLQTGGAFFTVPLPYCFSTHPWTPPALFTPPLSSGFCKLSSFSLFLLRRACASKNVLRLRTLAGVVSVGSPRPRSPLEHQRNKSCSLRLPTPSFNPLQSAELSSKVPKSARPLLYEIFSLSLITGLETISRHSSMIPC